MSNGVRIIAGEAEAKWTAVKKLHLRSEFFLTSRIRAIELNVEVYGCEFLFDISPPFASATSVSAHN